MVARLTFIFAISDGKVCSIQLYIIQIVSGLLKSSDFFLAFRFPAPIKLTYDITRSVESGIKHP
jgi:hypothetical protein